MNTQDLRAALRRRFPMPEWIVMEEVCHDGGRRRADAIAMNMWTSRGNEIHGFEIKAHRSDWLRELKNPAKADSIALYCDRWSIFAAPGVVKPDELPVAWGLFELKGDKVYEVIRAQVNKDARSLDRKFIAAMMRRCGELDASMRSRLVMDETANARQQARDEVNREIERRSKDLINLRQTLAKIKDQTGIDLEQWSFSDERVIAALKFALAAGNLSGRYYGLQSMKQQLEMTIQKIDEVMPLLPQIGEM